MTLISGFRARDDGFVLQKLLRPPPHRPRFQWPNKRNREVHQISCKHYHNRVNTCLSPSANSNKSRWMPNGFTLTFEQMQSSENVHKLGKLSLRIRIEVNIEIFTHKAGRKPMSLRMSRMSGMICGLRYFL